MVIFWVRYSGAVSHNAGRLSLRTIKKGLPMHIRDSRNQTEICQVDWLEERRLFSGFYGTNLVLNPGAETYNGTADGFNIITPADWTSDADPTVARYDRDLGPAIGIEKPANSGDAFFTGGPDTQSTDFFQTIDLSSIASTIDAGHVKFALSAQLGGNGFYDDNADAFVTFENSASTEVARLDTGSVSASDRDDTSKFLTRAIGGVIPATTRFAQIQIHFKRDEDSGYNYGFADNIALVLVTDTPATAGITPTVVRSTLPANAVGGAATRGALVLRLTNTDSSANIGVDTLSLFASTDGVVDSTSIPIGSYKRGIALGPGKSTLFSFPVRSFDLPAGTYTILAQTTDKYLTTVSATSGPTVVVAAPFVSLSASLGAVSPATVKSGRLVSFVLTLENAGNINSTGLANISIGLSTDGTTTSTPLITQVRRLTIRAENIPVRLRLLLRVPAGTATGTFTPFVIYTQGANSVTALGPSPFATE